MQKLFIILLAVMLSGSAAIVNGQSANTHKAVAINFNGGDIWAVASDTENAYVALAWCKYMVVINKATGEMKKVEADKDIQSVVVANNRCFYFVATKGIYEYSPSLDTSAGPLFPGFDPGWDDLSQAKMSVSPDGHYILCCGRVLDTMNGEIAGISYSGSSQAVNNKGNGYFGCPEAVYCPMNEQSYILSDRVVVKSVFIDSISGDAYFCCENGVGCVQDNPFPESGLRRIGNLQEYNVDCITRDDNGKFVYGLRDGIAFGGKSIDDTVVAHIPLKTGIVNSGMDITLNSVGIVASDGQGNIMASSGWSDFLVIYNPDGIKGYKNLVGKATRF